MFLRFQLQNPAVESKNKSATCRPDSETIGMAVRNVTAEGGKKKTPALESFTGLGCVAAQLPWELAATVANAFCVKEVLGKVKYRTEQFKRVSPLPASDTGSEL